MGIQEQSVDAAREDDVQGIENDALLRLFRRRNPVTALKGGAVLIPLRPHPDPVMLRVIEQRRTKNNARIVQVESLNRIDRANFVYRVRTLGPGQFLARQGTVPAQMEIAFGMKWSSPLSV